MQKITTILIVIMILLTACSNTPVSSDSINSDISIEGNWKTDNGEEMYINATDIFDSGFAMPYKIKSDTELAITDANGGEQIIEYSLKDDVLTLKIGQQGRVYHKQD